MVVAGRRLLLASGSLLLLAKGVPAQFDRCTYGYNGNGNPDGTGPAFPSSSACSSGVTKINDDVGFGSGEGLICSDYYGVRNGNPVFPSSSACSSGVTKVNE